MAANKRYAVYLALFVSGVCLAGTVKDKVQKDNKEQTSKTASEVLSKEADVECTKEKVLKAFSEEKRKSVDPAVVEAMQSKCRAVVMNPGKH